MTKIHLMWQIQDIGVTSHSSPETWAAAQQADVVAEQDHAQPLTQMEYRLPLVPTDDPGKLAAKLVNDPCSDSNCGIL